MAKKVPPKTRKATTRRNTRSRKTTKRFNTGKFTLGLLLLVVLGYSGLAIYEGQLVPKVFDEIEMPLFSEPESSGVKTTPPTETESQVPEAADVKEDDIDLEAFDLYFTKAFDFMWPAYSADQAIIERPYYTLRYNEEHEQAVWVAYRLSADSLSQEKFDRKDDFRRDPRVRTGSAELSDYRGSGYDRGQLAPAADFSYDEFALSQTFYMSNMSPQSPSFNRGIWKKLEEQVREWSLENSEIYVVTGPVLNKEFNTIGDNKVSVPEYYYKIILDIDKPGIKAIAFLLKNEKSSVPLNTFAVSIDEIEKLTGLDFFPSVPDDMENILEGKVNTDLWFR